MQALNRNTAADARRHPVRILQFGEGNFLRAFVDWMVDTMNKRIDFDAGIAVVQPIEQGLARLLDEQDGLYHLYLQGMRDGRPVSETVRVDAIQQAINPYQQHHDYLKLVDSPDLRFVVSNTTESGIAYDAADRPDMQPPKSFPAKVTSLLHRRYQTFNGDPARGLIFFCCELIDRNAEKLKELVLQYATDWQLPAAFIDWLENANTFCNTLVDRIVPGFPKEKIDSIHKELGYRDQLVVEGEYFHVWVIAAPSWVQKEFPAARAGLNVLFVDDLTPYRNLKVRILNGAHTASFAVSLLSGVETVQQSIEHEQIGRYMHDALLEEICPHIFGTDIPPADYAAQTLERFHNPYVRHFWKSIALNSVSKWQTRVLPSLQDYSKNTESLPARLVFSLAALVSYYRGEYRGQVVQPEDSADMIDFFRTAWSAYSDDEPSALKVAQAVLANRDCWQADLNQIPRLTESLAAWLLRIQRDGMPAALNHLLDTTTLV